MYTNEIWKLLFCRVRLEDSLSGVLSILHEEFGAQAVVVRRLDLQHRLLDTLAVERLPAAVAPATARTDLSSAEVEQLLGWVRRGMVSRGVAADDALLATLLGTPLDVDVLAGPLADEDEGQLGALILVGARGTFTSQCEAEAARLLEPFRVLLAAAHRLRELARLREHVEADNRALLDKLDRQEVVGTVVGSDSGFRDVMLRVDQVAPTDAPVMLLGETGTGKEVVARAIHDRSRRAAGPMLRVNCGAISPGLVDSELFGHERGSFTGAVAARAGWFERADGGTLFLDEIGELSLAAQVRLLRVLQEGVLERVGGQRVVPVSVRVVAATHRDLSEMVRAGDFREDLWYRISVFPIPLPPLRERREDIPGLAAHFAWHAGKRLGGQPLAPSSADIARLLEYGWPGNVRELAAVIERAAILGDGRHLEVAAALGPQVPIARTSRPPPSVLRPDPSAPLLTLDAAIRQHIETALSKTRGKIEGPGGAAELLAINPHTLRSRMRKLRIRWQEYRQT